MKTTLISNLHKPQIMECVIELFDFIEVSYGIKEPDERFSQFFITVLQNNYAHLNFEQIEDSFYRNSMGLLDNFLPKVGMRPDNKVMRFSIPDLTKIINAFCKYMGVEKIESKSEGKVFSKEEKNRNRIIFFDQLCDVFDTYRDLKKRSTIKTPTYTAKVLSNLGLIEWNKINLSDKGINILKIRPESKNTKLIYACFDELIEKQENINDYLEGFRSEFSEMPC